MAMAPSATSTAAQAVPAPVAVQEVIAEPGTVKQRKSTLAHDYKGFIAGVFSGVAKLTGTFFPMRP